MNGVLAGRSGRWLLLGSLAVNLALIVALLLPALGYGRNERGGGQRMATPWVLRAVLAPERQAEIEPILRQHRPALRTAVRAARDARREVDTELRRDPFERERLDGALALLRQRDQATAEALHAMLSDAIEQLDPAERQALAERLWQRHRAARQQGREERRQRRAQQGAMETDGG
jgi:uncharacterized membrane protein